jgi:hypothetical protein
MRRRHALPAGAHRSLFPLAVAPLLQKRYFGGGTVAAVAAGDDYVQRRRDVVARLEDGTPPFLSAACLVPALRRLRALGMESVDRCAVLGPASCGPC